MSFSLSSWLIFLNTSKDNNITNSSNSSSTSNSTSTSSNLDQEHFSSSKIIKFYICLIALNVVLFHLDKLAFNLFLFLLFGFGYFYYNLTNEKLKDELDTYLKTRRQKSIYPNGLIKLDGVNYDSLNEIEFELSSNSSSFSSFGQTRPQNNATHSNTVKFQFDQKSLISIIKPSLTDSYLIDDELHKIIELVIRDFIDSWYKSNISSKEEFSQLIRILIYNAIRQLRLWLKSIDWEYFITNVLANNVLVQLRIFKKSKEKLRSNGNLNKSSSYQNLTASKDSNQFQIAQSISKSNISSLIETFFDVEAELEKGVCRDNLSTNLQEGEDEFLQELTEILCYSLMSSKTFGCLPLRCIVREILAKKLIKPSINNITDPDYINMTILYLSQDEEPSIENFLTAINFCESLNELSEIRLKIDEEILRTRSNDKGGQNDHEIKLKLSSLSYIKRRTDSKILNIVKSLVRTENDNSNTSQTTINKNQTDFDNKQFINNMQLNYIELDAVIKNEETQHCFIEFMSKQNVQNLISFYLNADMYRQFAIKELSKFNNKNDQLSESSFYSSKEALRDFAKGLINSYLLSAVNFTAMSKDNDEEPINIANRVYYKRELIKTVECLENLELIDETSLDELQSKIYLLMKEKYFHQFKQSAEFTKLVNKSDLIYKISSSKNQSIQNDNSIVNNTQSYEDSFDSFTDMMYDEENNQISIDRLSQSSYDICYANDTNNKQTNQTDDPKTTKITASITSTGRCNELKKTYAIYIIDITKLNETNDKVDFWQTYRRYNDFHDFHLILKKNFPNLANLALPGRSFRNSINDDLIEKRIIELNRYLQQITNPDVLLRNPGLLELLLKFLENKRWEFSSKTSLKRRFDSILTPMITSVQTIQTSIKNAPDNVIGMVKGISDNLLNDSGNTNLNNNNNNNNANTSNLTNNKTNRPQLNHANSSILPLNLSPYQNQSSNSTNNLVLTSPKSNSTNTTNSNQKDISSTILNPDDLQTNNLPIKVILLLMDEIFDLKEKNQWLRQSLMAIIKSFMRNFKGDSMNRKIKEQIADYLGEESLARYLKNFRKRMWPKGVLAEDNIVRTNSSKDITKILVKTKLLSYVSDEFRHILGNDTTRRGIFELFDLIQHQPLNKRFLYILTENLFINFFSNGLSNSPANSLLPYLYLLPSIQSNSSILTQTSSTIHNHNQQLNSNPIPYLIRLLLSKSHRVKSEWKITKVHNAETTTESTQNIIKISSEKNNLLSVNNNISSVANLHLDSFLSKSLQLNTNKNNFGENMTRSYENPTNDDDNEEEESKLSRSRSSTFPRSKSLFSEIKC